MADGIYACKQFPLGVQILCGWVPVGRKKQSYYFRLRDGAAFAFPGLWEHWERDGRVVDSCTILTSDANHLVKPVHERAKGAGAEERGGSEAARGRISESVSVRGGAGIP